MHTLYCIPHSCVSHTHKQLSAVTSGERPYTITGKEDEYPADELTLQRTVHAVEKLSREVPITVWAIQGAQARHHSPPYCVPCDLPTYQMYISVPGRYTGHMTKQLLCAELEVLCWVYCDTGLGGGWDLDVLQYGISLHLHSNRPGCSGSPPETREDQSLLERTVPLVDDIVGLTYNPASSWMQPLCPLEESVLTSIMVLQLDPQYLQLLTTLIVEALKENGYSSSFICKHSCPDTGREWMNTSPEQLSTSFIQNRGEVCLFYFKSIHTR